MALPPNPDQRATSVTLVDASGAAVGAGTNSTTNVQGNVANGAADSGNPVKVGGRVTTTGNSFGNGQRADIQMDTSGAIRVYLGAPGSVASLGADGFLPVGANGRFNTTLPTLANGQRGDLQQTARGEMLVSLSSNGNSPVVGTSTVDGNAIQVGLYSISQGMVFNGNSWDRQRGDTSGTFIAANANSVETTTSLAANGTYTGNTKLAGSNSRYSFFIANVFADQAGTLFIEQSNDSTTWYAANGTAGQAVAAGASVQERISVATVFYRARYVNGTTAQTKFFFSTALSLN